MDACVPFQVIRMFQTMIFLIEMAKFVFSEHCDDLSMCASTFTYDEYTCVVWVVSFQTHVLSCQIMPRSIFKTFWNHVFFQKIYFWDILLKQSKFWKFWISKKWIFQICLKKFYECLNWSKNRSRHYYDIRGYVFESLDPKQHKYAHPK